MIKEKNEKPVAIVLGGTVPHKFLIDNLKRRDYYTILVDFYDNPPAAKTADRHIQESTLDKEKVLKIARDEFASLVISGCVDQANVTACYVAEQLGLPAPYSYETSLRVTDKMLMKEGLVASGVHTADYQVVSDIDQIELAKVHFPVVVKPADCNGSKGVRKVYDKDELANALAGAIALSRTKKAIVEQFNNGIEVNGYYYIKDGKAVELYIKGKKLPRVDRKSSLQSFMSIGPADITDKARNTLRENTELIAKEFDLSNTPLLIQANIDRNDCSIIEFAPRVGGGLAFREIEYQTGFDIIDSVVNSYLGRNVDTKKIVNSDHNVSIIHMYGTHGIFLKVDGLDELVTQGIIKEYHMHKVAGMPLTIEDLSSRNRVFGVVIVFDSLNDLKERIASLLAGVKLYNSDFEEVLYRVPFSAIL